MLRYVSLQIFIDVSEDCNAFFFQGQAVQKILVLETERRRHCNPPKVDEYIQADMAQHLRRVETAACETLITPTYAACLL